MTITLTQTALYAGAIALLFATPGPVWVALIARAMSGGFGAAWPLALGVVIGDVLWPLLAIWGMSWVLASWGGALDLLRWVACAMFIGMGVMVIRHADSTIARDTRLTRPGTWAGFLAGLAVILGNPKAILFYMGVLPGFFDLGRLGAADIAVICAISFVIPLLGNLALAGFVTRAKRFLASPRAVRRSNLIAGVLLICVGLVLPLM